MITEQVHIHQPHFLSLGLKVTIELNIHFMTVHCHRPSARSLSFIIVFYPSSTLTLISSLFHWQLFFFYCLKTVSFAWLLFKSSFRFTAKLKRKWRIYIHLCPPLPKSLRISTSRMVHLLLIDEPTHHYQASLVAQLVKNQPAMQETPVGFLGWEDPLEKG